MWPSKKAAKEAVAELAVERFEAVKDSLIRTKRKKGDVGSGVQGETVDRSENWIGLLVGKRCRGHAPGHPFGVLISS